MITLSCLFFKVLGTVISEEMVAEPYWDSKFSTLGSASRYTAFLHYAKLKYITDCLLSWLLIGQNLGKVNSVWFGLMLVSTRPRYTKINHSCYTNFYQIIFFSIHSMNRLPKLFHNLKYVRKNPGMHIL